MMWLGLLQRFIRAQDNVEPYRIPDTGFPDGDMLFD